MSINQFDCLNICNILGLSPSPKSLENSGKNTWVKSFGINIRTLTIESTDEYMPASELLKYIPITIIERYPVPVLATVPSMLTKP